MLNSINILIAEDNPLNQKIATFILQKQRASVASAITGQEVIDLLQEGPFDIILMDLQMPEMDGYEAARYIRKDMGNTIPIIAVSASMTAHELDESVAAGMDAYVSKPFDAEELCNTILRLVNAHKM